MRRPRRGRAHRRAAARADGEGGGGRVGAPATVRALVAEIGLTAIQAHGDETPEECADYGVPVVKAFGVGPDFDPATIEPFRAYVVLLDGVAGEARGGTGRRADWGIARRVVESGYRVLLAGGLAPENIVEAVETVEPLGIDLNSGVERAPGIKDPERLARALGALAQDGRRQRRAHGLGRPSG